MAQAGSFGHIYLPENELAGEVSRLIGVDDLFISEAWKSLFMRRKSSKRKKKTR